VAAQHNLGARFISLSRDSSEFRPCGCNTAVRWVPVFVARYPRSAYTNIEWRAAKVLEVCAEVLHGNNFVQIGLAAGTRIWIVAGVTDMRRGFVGLSGMVQTALACQSVTGPVAQTLTRAPTGPAFRLITVLRRTNGPRTIRQ
jgi:hypothetical protein